MSTIRQVAAAFIEGRAASCHNAKTDGSTYWLHGHAIAFDWCGWHTPTTANHMNAILALLPHSMRVSYAEARDGKAPGRFSRLLP